MLHAGVEDVILGQSKVIVGSANGDISSQQG